MDAKTKTGIERAEVIRWLKHERDHAEREANSFASIGHGTLSMKARSMAVALAVIIDKFEREFK